MIWESDFKLLPKKVAKSHDQYSFQFFRKILSFMLLSIYVNDIVFALNRSHKKQKDSLETLAALI